MCNEDIKVRTASIGIDISKICWLIDKNDLDKFIEIVKNLYKIYGGVYHIIIPVFNDSIDEASERLIKIYEPDIFITCLGINNSLKKRLYMLSYPLKMIESDSLEGRFIGLKEMLNKLEYSKKGLKIDYYNNSSIDKDYRKFLEMIYPYDEIVSIANEQKLVMEESYDNSFSFLLNNNVFRILNPNIETQVLFWNMSKKARYSNNFKEISRVLESKEKEYLDLNNKSKKLFPSFQYFDELFIFNNSINVIVGSCNSVEDLCMYWNTRVICPVSNTLWLPIEKVSSEDDINELCKYLSKINSGDININILSYSLDNKKLNTLKLSILENLKDTEEREFIVTLNPNAPTEIIGKRYVIKSYKQDILYNKGKATLIPRLPEHIESFAYSKGMSIIANIDIYKYPMPKMKGISKLICDEKIRLARITNCGIRVDNLHNTVELIEPDEFDVIKAVLKAKGYEITVSDKGQIARKIINTIGDIGECKIFKDLSVLKLIEHLSNNNRQYENLNVIKEYLSNAKDVNEKTEYLIDKKILFRGFVLKCKDCSTVNWIPIDSIKESNICSGCLTKMKLPINTEIMYKLNALIQHGYNQGAITHIVTLVKYMEGKMLKFYVPGVIINNLNREVDIIAVDSNGIIICECKNDGNELKNAEIDSVLQIGNLIDAEKVVFGCMKKSFTNAVKAKYANNEKIEFIEENVKEEK